MFFSVQILNTYTYGESGSVSGRGVVGRWNVEVLWVTVVAGAAGVVGGASGTTSSALAGNRKVIVKLYKKKQNNLPF